MSHFEDPMIRVYTSQEMHEALETLIEALSGLSGDIGSLRQDFSDLRSDLRSVREQNQRQDLEIWASDGLSRLSALQADTQRHSLQIKGLWAVITAMAGFGASCLVRHL